VILSTTLRFLVSGSSRGTLDLAFFSSWSPQLLRNWIESQHPLITGAYLIAIGRPIVRLSIFYNLGVVEF